MITVRPKDMRLNKQVRIYKPALTHLTAIIYLVLMASLPSRLL